MVVDPNSFAFAGMQGMSSTPFGHSAPVAVSKKRKDMEEPTDFDPQGNGGIAGRRKLALPRCIPGSLNAEAQFHPLPPDLNRETLASLGYLPGQGGNLFSAGVPSSDNSPSSPFSELPPSTPTDGQSYSMRPFFGSNEAGDGGYFSQDRSSYAHPNSSPNRAFGIFEPTAGACGNGMDVDGDQTNRSAVQGHGPHCKSIPQLSVRTCNGTASELWATCVDCGACTKVQSDKPADLSYSP